MKLTKRLIRNSKYIEMWVRAEGAGLGKWKCITCGNEGTGDWHIIRFNCGYADSQLKEREECRNIATAPLTIKEVEKALFDWVKEHPKYEIAHN